MLKILVVEDTPKHMADALRVAAEMGIEVVTATNAEDAGRAMRKLKGYDEHEKLVYTPQVDGVVTDIFLPLAEREPYNHAKSPCGIKVAFQAQNAGILFELCTDGYHHGAELEWIAELGVELGWPYMIDGGQKHGDVSPSKPWRRAFESLTARLEDAAA